MAGTCLNAAFAALAEATHDGSLTDGLTRPQNAINPNISHCLEGREGMVTLEPKAESVRKRPQKHPISRGRPTHLTPFKSLESLMIDRNRSPETPTIVRPKVTT